MPHSSLAEFLGVVNPKDHGAPIVDASAHIETLTGKAFAEAVLNSRDFRQYIVNGLACGDLAPAVLCRLIDHAWGKPPDKIEHTGKDGQPIAITHVRSIIVDPQQHDDDEEVDSARVAAPHVH